MARGPRAKQAAPLPAGREIPATTSGARKGRPRTKPAEQRRDELLNAAERLFLDQGVAPTTVEQITAGAGVAKGTFYLYFASKDDVLAALGDRFAEQHLARMTAAIASLPDRNWPLKLTVWARANVTFYLDSIRLHDALFYGFRPATREGLIDNIVIDHLAALLAAGMKAEAWSLDDPRATAVFIFSGVHAVVDDAYSKERRIDRKSLAQRLEHLCLRAVGIAPR
jgi:AcrR family transcriptional regulator